MDWIGVVYTAACRTRGCRWHQDCVTEHLAQLAAERHEREQDNHRTCVLTFQDHVSVA